MFDKLHKAHKLYQRSWVCSDTRPLARQCGPCPPLRYPRLFYADLGSALEIFAVRVQIVGRHSVLAMFVLCF